MTKKKPSPQNRIWEKERRDRLNQTFDNLSKLLPEYEPATQLSKIEILQRAIEYVEKLQDKINAFLEERDALLKKHVDELEERLQALIARNEDLAALLKKANINVPPCKHGSGVEKERPEEKPAEPQEVGKNASKPNKKTSPRKRNKEPEPSTQTEANGEPALGSSNSIVTSSAAVNSLTNACVVMTEANAATLKPAVTTTDGSSAASVIPKMHSTLPSTCFVMANNQIVGTLKQATGVNVTPALLSTPIMATGVLISNNGSVLQMPLVPQQSSLLIVSNEDVRSKISLEKKSRSSADSAKAPAKSRTSKGAKFSIKSIDVIPGRIVNGKIPIPPLKQPPRPTKKMLREICRKRRKRKMAEPKESDAKKPKINETESATVPEKVACAQKSTEEVQMSKEKPADVVEEAKEADPKQIEASSLDMNLDQTDLSNDIFANLQVPDGEPDDNQGSLSPTAAYLMNFPLVATGGKIAGNHHVDAPEGDVSDVAEVGKKVSTQQTTDNNLLLDNFSSYFSTNVYGGGSETPVTAAAPDGQISSVATCTSFSTIYQSIDSMLEHKTARTKSNSDCRYNATPFTFTLTPTSTTTSTQPSFDYRHPSTSSYYYSTPVATSKPMDDYCILKPSIVTEFTFSLTSTTPSVAKTVQSQYANSSIHTSTITTSSYNTYGNQPNFAKSTSYSANYITGTTSQIDTRTSEKYDFLETEKPATSFTFSLTSTTKTLPKYTQASTSSACAIQNIISSSSTLNKVEDCLYKSSRPGGVHGHQTLKTTPKQKSSSQSVASGCNANYQSQSGTGYHQSKYDVPWMASQDPKPSTSLNQDYNQIMPALDFNAAPSHSYQTNIDLSRKSDIFFAHPTGEENLATWSPSKLTNILNDTSSPYYPPTTVSLPNLNGDLALNTISSGYQSTPGTVKPTTQNRKGNDSSSTFLSVQQLVDQPRKATSKNYSSCGNYSTHHKPPQNNYSAEALIASASGSTSSKKEKYVNDPNFNGYTSYGTDASVASGLSFNFDYPTDYNKNYNYTCQQNYMTSFMDNGYGLPALPAPTVTSSSSAVTNYGSYGYGPEKKQPASYYPNASSYQPTAPSDIPYYVPSSEKRSAAPLASTKPKKALKPLAPANEYASALPSTSASSYFPAILPPPPPNLADDPLCYSNNFSFNPAGTTKNHSSSGSGSSSSCYNQSYHHPTSRTVPGYCFGSGAIQSFAATHCASSSSVSSNSLANFNLSTICPEISEKNATAGGAVAVAAGTAITGGAGW
ncbi:serine-rich adhesin for platelets-like [Sabethes cyaneus]|uniref:serine-rich adhesin for platelets-like n=1 Tax=Sabethes cyaneus TaxID=53552 RepID=UPI00237E9F03|nr:serine-rich adhesin for platelets-like [Sabethes cyaneus]